MFPINRKAKQVTSLFSSMSLGILIGIGVSVVNTRFLGPELYGDFKFLQTLFTFFITFLTFGFFYSAGRIVAQKKNKNSRNEIFGGILYIAAIISVLFILILLIFSFFEDQIFGNHIGRMIRIFSPLLFVFPFQLCLENILQGDNRIYLLSAFRLGPKSLYLFAAILLNYFIPLSLTTALLLHLTTLAVLIVIVLIRLKPKFKNFKEVYSKILSENKTYGFPVFIGAITGMASHQLAGLSISYFIDNTNVGFYSLALTATMPLSLIPGSIGITFFKDFVGMQKIPRKVGIYTVLVSLVSLVIFFVLIKKLVLLLYTEEYLPVVPIAYYVSVGSMFHGFGDFLNRFIGAHGKGKQLRNSNFILCFINLLGYFGLVYFIGVLGAAITKLIAGLVYAGIMLYYYRSIRGKEK